MAATTPAANKSAAPLSAVLDSSACLSQQAAGMRLSKHDDVSVLTDIYSEENNIVIWKRELPPALLRAVHEFVAANPIFQTSMTVSPKTVLSGLTTVHSLSDQTELCQDIAELVDMFCTLFEVNQAGLRLAVLHKAMCPKFHVDQVPCRLLTTYQGIATEWLPHHLADRTKLGRGSNGLPDHESGLYQHRQDIQQLSDGDVALLKGERWEGNEGAGLIHRSPALATGEKRLLLTLDFAI